MMLHLRGAYRRILLTLALFLPISAFAQGGNAGTISGTVTDPSGAVIPGATVHLANPVSGYERTATTDSVGKFEFVNVPFNPYHVTISAKGFSATSQDVEIRSSIGASLKVALPLTGANSTVTVEATGGDLVENDPTFHTDVDRDLFVKVPMESQSSSLSSLVTNSTPGVAADSNGLFHGLGDHASNSFSIDGQPITDQQSKVFSNQIPSNAIQSIEVISGAPPAEFGGKTSLVIEATTRSGQGITRPTGSISASYGSFGSATLGFDLSYGGKNWGNFLEADGLNTSRFLDPPEFRIFHDKGNEENFFDRVDYSLSSSDSLHLNLNYSRSWFQTPNSYDSLDIQNVVSDGTSANPVFGSVGATDQLSKIGTFNIAPTWTHIITPTSVLNFGAFVRKDLYQYYGSENPLADAIPFLQSIAIDQSRTLLNTGVHADYSYVAGRHNFKAGAVYQHTFLREHDSLATVDQLFNAPCVDADGNPAYGYSADTCPEGQENPDFLPELAPYDLTRGGGFYTYFGHADIKELALYVQDQIKAGNWLFNLGLRGDLYNGLTTAGETQPRVGIAYNIKQTNTVLRVSYARTLETPFNENLVLSSEGCTNDILAPLLACAPGVQGTFQPGFRNEFHAGFQQAFSKYAVVSGEYIWKYTHNAFDFGVLGNTPITFPIDWHNSKIPGWALNIKVPELHGFSAYSVMSSVAARFFPPQAAGAGASPEGGTPFRIDHDEKYNQTTHIQYQLKHGPLKGVWTGWNWRYDSGLVAGAVPFGDDPNTPIDLSGLSYDQQFEAGISCGGVKATPTSGFDSCAPSDYKSSLVSIPAAGTEDDDKNPPRIAPRNLFDLSVGQDNIFHADRYKVNLDLTAINITNSYSLYNFLSTFSGTHYVTPRALTARVTFNF